MLMFSAISQRKFVGVISLFLGGSFAHAEEVISIDTSQAPLEGTSWNQGWWSNTKSNANTANSSPFLGTLNGSHRNFFTFLLPSLANKEVISATLLQNRGVGSPTNESHETIGFFHVATAPEVLNHNVGSSATIYNDLGSGTSYGEFTIATLGTTNTLYECELNSAAVEDINSAAGGYFSVGGSLLSDDGDDFIFGGQVHGPAVLRLVVIPEPPTIIAVLVLSALGSCLTRRCS